MASMGISQRTYPEADADSIRRFGLPGFKFKKDESYDFPLANV
jgi:hypothetical protein